MYYDWFISLATFPSKFSSRKTKRRVSQTSVANQCGNMTFMLFFYILVWERLHQICVERSWMYYRALGAMKRRKQLICHVVSCSLRQNLFDKSVSFVKTFLTQYLKRIQDFLSGPTRFSLCFWWQTFRFCIEDASKSEQIVIKFSKHVHDASNAFLEILDEDKN